MVEVDPKGVFIIPKFWGGIVSALLALLISLIGYVYVYQIGSMKEDIYQMQQQIRDAEIRQLSTIDVLQELRPERDIINMVERQRMKYYRYNVRGSKTHTE